MAERMSDERIGELVDWDRKDVGCAWDSPCGAYEDILDALVAERKICEKAIRIVADRLWIEAHWVVADNNIEEFIKAVIRAAAEEV